MADIIKNLELRYNSFINKDQPWSFFRGLADYIEYILTTPRLKNIIDREFAKRNLGYKLLERYEQTAIDEFNEAKTKLVKIIKDKKIDVNSFTQNTSFIPTFRGADKQPNILEQLEMFEDGRMSIGGFYSDNLERYLFDIASNLVSLGYKDEIKEFIVSNQDYIKYYRRINDDSSSDMMFAGNINGAFIFSETWPKRFEQVVKVEMARKAESWGTFEALIKFWKARTFALKNSNREEILESCNEDKDFYLGGSDAVDVLYAVQDFKILTLDENNHIARNALDDTDIHFLNIEKFKTFSSTVQGRLVQAVLDDGNPEIQMKRRALKKALEIQKDKAWHGMVDNFMEKMENFMEKTEVFIQESRLAKEVNESEKQEEIGKWWGEEKPTYDKKKRVIKLGEKICSISSDAQNQLAICEALFSRPIGAWLQKYEVSHKLKDGDNAHAFYDAGYKLNQKIEKDLRVVGMLKNGTTRIAMNKELFDG